MGPGHVSRLLIYSEELNLTDIYPFLSPRLIIDFTTQSSPTSKIKIELIWLSLLSIFLLGGSTALTATLPFPKFDLLSEELRWMGKLASDRLFQAQVLSWVASLLREFSVAL